MNRIDIHKASENEAGLVIKLLKALYQELGEEQSSVAFLTGDLIRSFMNSHQTAIYLVTAGPGDPVALFTLTETQAIYAGGKYACLDEMYVKPAYRSQAIGAAIIAKIKELASAKGWKRVDVTAPTEERWKRTVKFYEANGFVFTGPKLKLNIF